MVMCGVCAEMCIFISSQCGDGLLPSGRLAPRVGQDHIYTVYTRTYFAVVSSEIQSYATCIHAFGQDYTYTVYTQTLFAVVSSNIQS